MPLAAIGGLVGGVGSLIGGLVGSSGASSAGKTVAHWGEAAGASMANATNTAVTGINNATNQAVAGVGPAVSGAQNYMAQGLGQGNQTLANVYGQQTQNLQPYLATGQAGATGLANAIAPGGALSGSFTAPTAAQAEATPGYQFQLQQGLQAAQRSAAAGGSLQSGGTLKSLEQYGQGLASTYYQNAFSNSLQGYQTNYQNTLNSLGTAANLGMGASSLYNQAASNFGNATNQNYMGAAQYMGNAGRTGAQMAGGFVKRVTAVQESLAQHGHAQPVRGVSQLGIVRRQHA